MQPFLDSDFLVRWSKLVPEAVEADILHALEEGRKNIEAIAALDPTEATYDQTFGALEDASVALDRGWGRLQHLDSVNDSPPQREALNKMLPQVSAFYSSIPLNDRLWNVLRGVGTSVKVHDLDPVRQRHVQETLASFEQAGADLPPSEKKRVAEIDAELSRLTQRFGEHVLDATNAWERLIDDEAQLAGLPTSARSAALASAKSKGLGTPEKPVWRFTLQAPSMMPVMQHLEDDGIRREIWEASTKIGAVGEKDNTSLIWEILDLREEKAALLGKKNFADLTLARRMAKDGATALEFIENLHQRIAGKFLEEAGSLSQYKAKQTGTEAEPLEPWESAFWAEKRRKQEYDLDDELLRPYFSVEKVMAGMFEIASRVFGITISSRDSVFLEPGSGADAEGVVEVWHPEVKFYEIHDSALGSHLGSFYADWHPRESKRGGAWMNCLHTGHQGEAHLGLIIGNMSPPVDGKPALLTHSEVETIFHEFGHLLHGMLSDVSVRSLAGTAVPWDFVELPSQIMENFCWERESLDIFASHIESGEKIPEDLFQRMIAAKNYMSASAFMRQLALAKLDLELHLNLDEYRGRDLDEVDRDVLAEYRAPMKTQSPSMARRFLHLFSSPTGYAAGYYSYKWAEVLDADAFTRFQNEGVLNPATGHAFREMILSRGNSMPPEELYRMFMGRDPELEPLLVRAGLAGDVAA